MQGTEFATMAATRTRSRKGQPVRLIPGGRSARKRRDVLGAAAELFLARGYDAVSLDEIIASAGGSKASIYSHFTNKEGVFLASVKSLCDEIQVELSRSEGFLLPLRAALFAIGCDFLDAVLSPRAIALHRLVISESRRFPEIARGWFENGPAQTYHRLTAFFAERKQAGEVSATTEPRTLAVLFHDMLVFEIYQPVLIGMSKKPKPDVIEAKVRSAIDILLSACTTA
jgi:TetR/AcrR family transcriptional regulator, mexJK operon transcriptional repressor